ncbi:MAG TPA: stage II sporulation protein R [Candidatus Gemmiger excrementipullorum]|uniref:Stage II sporulation protein R n=1 Tax=Candidatus Gemmiger excrementipullorum TaxID=2838610 RepID=A0A9D1XZW9_9FIRM|nr:stage II sporulation protein R [Candidatus Gemmiger excrementipullorum]
MIRTPKRKVLELGVGLGLLLSVVLTVAAAQRGKVAAQVRADTIRLHVLANSDTIEDQLLKLEVRDAILDALPTAVTAAATPRQAAQALRTALPRLQRAANLALHQAHSAQRAAVRLETADFAARAYGSFALPGGAYTALRVELGDAQGHNWFCVLYPALCVAGATAEYPTPQENALVFGRYEVRFALWDALQGLA